MSVSFSKDGMERNARERKILCQRETVNQQSVPSASLGGFIDKLEKIKFQEYMLLTSYSSKSSIKIHITLKH